MGKAKGKGSARVGRPPSPEGPRVNSMRVKARPGWLAWVERFAASEGLTASGLVEAALRERAERSGFERPPER